MKVLMLAFLLTPAYAADTPFHLQGVTSDRDISSLNENFRSAADSIRKVDLTLGGTVDGDLTVDRLVFPDGTSQTTAWTTTVDAPASSFTRVNPGNTAQATFIVAFATVTLTLNNVDMMVCLTGNASGSVGQILGWSFMVNGAFPTGLFLTPTAGVVMVQAADNQYAENISSCFPLPAQGSGSKSFGLTFKVDGGSIVWPDADAAATTSLRFGVFEIR